MRGFGQGILDGHSGNEDKTTKSERPPNCMLHSDGRKGFVGKERLKVKGENWELGRERRAFCIFGEGTKWAHKLFCSLIDDERK
jgi:hypothetical protein